MHDRIAFAIDLLVSHLKWSDMGISTSALSMSISLSGELEVRRHINGSFQMNSCLRSVLSELAPLRDVRLPCVPQLSSSWVGTQRLRPEFKQLVLCTWRCEPSWFGSDHLPSILGNLPCATTLLFSIHLSSRDFGRTFVVVTTLPFSDQLHARRCSSAFVSGIWCNVALTPMNHTFIGLHFESLVGSSAITFALFSSV